MVTLLFNGVGILLLFQFFKFKYLDFVAESHKTNFWKFSRHKYVLNGWGHFDSYSRCRRANSARCLSSSLGNESPAFWKLLRCISGVRNKASFG